MKVKVKRTQIIAASAALLVVTAGFWLYGRNNRSDQSGYRFATVERGDLEAAVSATGKLDAVTAVQVGTQVSGQVEAIHVDFNDRVRKGQLIARIDPTLAQQAVQEGLAGLDRAQAEVAQAQREYDRNKQLFDRKVLTEAEFNNVQYRLAIAQANVRSAQVTLSRARQNLAYTSIYAPIDGIVVERNVDVGQTVAASLSAPQLFLIANDLSRMQILASVDESDIGLIHEGQTARFTVQAYPNQAFLGTVRQVRLQSTTQENVVNYTAVVEVQNTDGRLLPGMTATVDFLTGTAQNALLVPNAALRFRPTEAMLAELRSRQGSNGNGRDSAIRDSGRARFGTARAGGAAGPAAAGAPTGARAGGGRAGGRASESAMLWYIDKDGKVAASRVRVGLTDGQRTQIEGPGIGEGMQVIIGAQAGQAAQGASTPFQQQQQGGFRPPGTF